MPLEQITPLYNLVYTRGFNILQNHDSPEKGFLNEALTCDEDLLFHFRAVTIASKAIS